jgi:hypothetical protein
MHMSVYRSYDIHTMVDAVWLIINGRLYFPLPMHTHYVYMIDLIDYMIHYLRRDVDKVCEACIQQAPSSPKFSTIPDCQSFSA